MAKALKKRPKPIAKPKFKYRFRLLRGGHRAGDHLVNGVMTGGTDYNAGDIVETNKNLAQKFGYDKFQPIGPHGEPLPYGSAPGETVEQPAERGFFDGDVGHPKDFPNMTLKELVHFAEDREVDLGDAETKNDVIGIIRSAGY